MLGPRPSRWLVGLGLGLVAGLLPTGSRPQGPTPPLTLPGQSATLLPDGRWLVVGGLGAQGPVGTLWVWDARTGNLAATGASLQVPRAGHTATLLPTGGVWVFGGVDASGMPVGVAERIGAEPWPIDATTPPGLTPRAQHTATVLSDGRVLLAGGSGPDGQPLASIELYDWRSETGQLAAARLAEARQGHTATLQPDGTVVLWGGLDAGGLSLNDGARYDPGVDAVTTVLSPPPLPAVGDLPVVTAIEPVDGASAVPTDSLIALRFSQPLRVDSLSGSTMTLAGPDGLEPLRVVPVEAGRLVFLTPERGLRPGTLYTLTVNGPTTADGRPLPFTTGTFTTAGAPPDAEAAMPPSSDPDPAAEPGSSTSGAATETASPVAADEWGPWTGPTRNGKPYSPWQDLPPLQGRPGQTALAGQVLRLSGDPLPRVTLAIEPAGGQPPIRTTTDDTGRFLLPGLPGGHQELLIDGRSASRSGRVYGVFEVGVPLAAGTTTVLPYTIWMPAVDVANAVTIPSPAPTDLVITTPRLPGLELHLSAGTVIRDHEWRVSREVSITPIPLDRPPFPLPEGVQVPLYFTVQPGGGYVTGPAGGARLIYPNGLQAPAGSRFEFWHYAPGGPGWHVYGLGTVGPDGQQVTPDPGVEVYEFTGAMAAPPPQKPPDGPCHGPGCGRGGDPVDLATGLFVMAKTDLTVADTLPIVLTRTYRTRDTIPRAFGVGASHPYDLFLVRDGALYAFLELILPDGAAIRFDRIAPAGTGYSPDLVFEALSTRTLWYKARIVVGGPQWVLSRRDGMVYEFPDGFAAARPMQAAVWAIRDRFGTALTLTRNADLDLTRITTPNGRFVQFAIDPQHRITEAQDHTGRTIRYTYDASGRLATVTDALGGVTAYTYDTSHRMLTLKDARGIIFLTNEYDANGRVVRQTQADTTTYQFAYTLSGSQVTQTDVTDPRGIVRRVTFATHAGMLTDTRALGRPEQQATTYEYQPTTTLMSATGDALGRRTEYTYDSLGNVASVRRLAGTPSAVTMTYTYDPTYSQLTSVTDPLNHPTTFGYNPQGALTSVTDALIHQTTMTPDAAGRPTAITTPLNHTTQLSYTGGELTTITDPLGQATQRGYDTLGRLVAVTDPRGRRTTYTYDPLNRLRQVLDPASGPTQFTSDPNGNLLTVTDARGNTTTYTYDVMDRLATRTDPLGRLESYQYDANGNLAQVTDRKGQVTTFTYDGLNRRTQALYQGGSTTSYTYDAGHRLTQVVDSLMGTITRVYDGLDRLTSETTPKGTVSVTYDAAGRRATMTVSGQTPIVYTFDAADRLTQLTRGSSTVSLQYDDANRRTRLTLPTTLTVDYGYDTAARLTGLTYKVGTTTLGTLSYAYDAAGNRTEVGGTWARTTLPAAVASATYDAANRLTQWGASPLSYDLNGNLTSDGTKTYTWNPRDQLSSMTGATFQYDGLGRRQKRVVGSTTREFLYDGLNLVQEKQGNQVKANVFPGLGLDEVFTRSEGNTTRVLLPDALGSTLALTTTAGAVQTEYTYAPFGETTTTGSANTNPFQYTGRENDGTGLYYYRARYYHPGLYRFLSEDPIEFAAGDTNLYAYVLNNPLAYGDPLGLHPVVIVIRLVKLVGPRMIHVARLGLARAIELRRSGANIATNSQTVAREIEKAAFPKGTPIPHGPHRSGFRPHYQTPGQPGHTFFGGMVPGGPGPGVPGGPGGPGNEDGPDTGGPDDGLLPSCSGRKDAC